MSKKQSKPINVVVPELIEHKILFIRGKKVMLDRDLADLYQVKPFRLREQVKRNIKRFPSDFMFQLSENEINRMVSQNAIPSHKVLGGHRLKEKPHWVSLKYLIGRVQMKISTIFLSVSLFLVFIGTVFANGSDNISIDIQTMRAVNQEQSVLKKDVELLRLEVTKSELQKKKQMLQKELLESSGMSLQNVSSVENAGRTDKQEPVASVVKERVTVELAGLIVGETYKEAIIDIDGKRYFLREGDQTGNITVRKISGESVEVQYEDGLEKKLRISY